MTQNFTKLIKNDVEYVFSFLIVLHLKDILVQIRREKIRDISQVSKFLHNRFGINIAGMNENQFNSFFMDYFYQALDLHEDSKHKIIFPQTKMIEFINKLKI